MKPMGQKPMYVTIYVNIQWRKSEKSSRFFPKSQHGVRAGSERRPRPPWRFLKSSATFGSLTTTAGVAWCWGTKEVVLPVGSAGGTRRARRPHLLEHGEEQQQAVRRRPAGRGEHKRGEERCRAKAGVESRDSVLVEQSVAGLSRGGSFSGGLEKIAAVVLDLEAVLDVCCCEEEKGCCIFFRLGGKVLSGGSTAVCWKC